MKTLSKTLLTFAMILTGIFLLTKINLPSGGDTRKLEALLPAEDRTADNAGVYFWAGRAGEPSEIVQTGSNLLEDLGAENIRITMSAKSDMDYKGGGCIAGFTLKGLAQRDDFRSILSDSSFQTIMITAYDGVSLPNCFTKNYLNPDFFTANNTQKIEQEYADFARYLSGFADKTFIISNWEGDNDIYCGSSYDTTAARCPGYQRTMAGFTKWSNASAAGIRASGAGNVFSAVEFNHVNILKDRGLPSVLYDVIPAVNADYFSYSSYESLAGIDSGDGGERLRTDIGTIRDVLSSAGKNPDNLIIGEYGFDRGSREETQAKIAVATAVFSELDVKYAFVWNLLDVAGPFGLYDVALNLTPTGKYFCEIWDGSACGPPLTLTNITEAGRNPRFWTIDSWRLELKNAQPDAALKICAEQNGNALGCTPIEDLGFGVASATDGNGGWTLENSWVGFDDTSLVGIWKEWVEANGVRLTAVRFKILSPDLTNPNAGLFIPESERIIGEPLSYKTDKLTALFGGDGGEINEKLEAKNGTPPYSWSIIRGQLPPGFDLDGDGTFSGRVGVVLDGKLIKTAHALTGDGFGVEVRDSASRRAAADIRLGANIANAATPGSSGGLVPCGRLQDDPKTPENEMRICTVCDTLVLASRVINFVLFTLVPAIAVLLYLIAGFMILLGGAHPGWVATGTSIFKTTTWGVIIIFASWMITNSVLKSIAGNSLFTKDWNKVVCVEPAPQPPPSTQTYNCSSQNICVAVTGGQYTEPTCGGNCAPAASPTPTALPAGCFDVDGNGIIDEIDCGSPENINCSLCGAGPTPSPTSTTTPTPTPTPTSTPPGQGALAIDTTSLPDAVVGRSYTAPVNARGGTTPYTFSISAGSLPPGLTISSGGVITGTPTTAGNGSYGFTVRVQDSTTPTRLSATRPLSIKVVPASAAVVISNVAVNSITQNSARITWSTDKPATSQVEYSTSSTFSPSTSTTIDSTPKTSHVVNLTGLTDNTTYYYRAKSSISGFTAVSSTNNFKTLMGATTPTPTSTRTPTPTPTRTPTPTPTLSSTPSPSPLACMYNGVNYATLNLCNGQRRPGGCGSSVCAQYNDSINRYASGAATAQLLKTMMVIESDCNIRAGTSSSYGLMQLRPETANRFKSRCGVTENITSAWLTNPANADKSICIGAAFVNSIAAGACGSQPRNIYAGYNAGPGNCTASSDCANDRSCDGGTVKKWECAYNDPAHTTCNTGFYETKQGATYVNYCMNNLGF